MQFIGKILAKLWRAVVLFSWCLLGLWTALAVYFTVPAPGWLVVSLALVIGVLFVISLRERFYVRGHGIPWRNLRPHRGDSVLQNMTHPSRSKALAPLDARDCKLIAGD